MLIYIGNVVGVDVIIYLYQMMMITMKKRRRKKKTFNMTRTYNCHVIITNKLENMTFSLKIVKK